MSIKVMKYEEFKKKCVELGFKKLDDASGQFILWYDLSPVDDEETDFAERPKIILENMGGNPRFTFHSGLCNEVVCLNTLDPVTVVAWGNTISNIESNY